MDLCARALLMAERMVVDGQLEQALRDRYQGWAGDYGRQVLAGQLTLEAVAARTLERNLDTGAPLRAPGVPGTLLNRYI